MPWAVAVTRTEAALSRAYAGARPGATVAAGRRHGGANTVNA